MDPDLIGLGQMSNGLVNLWIRLSVIDWGLGKQMLV